LGIGGVVSNRTGSASARVAYLGELDEQGRLGVQRATQPAAALQPELFDQAPDAEWVEADLRGVRVESSHPFGGSWLGLMLLRQLGFSELLETLLPCGREEVPWSVMTLVQNFNKSHCSRSYCRRGPVSPSESDVSAAPLTIRQSCCKDLA
jgi:hypothetical protein